MNLNNEFSLNDLYKIIPLFFSAIILMAIAYFLARTFASGIQQVKCISLECGLQNGTLAVFVATEISNEIVYIIPTAAYALIMYITGFIFIWLIRKSS